MSKRSKQLRSFDQFCVMQTQRIIQDLKRFGRVTKTCDRVPMTATNVPLEQFYIRKETVGVSYARTVGTEKRHVLTVGAKEQR